MSPEERQQALDNISVEDLAKIQSKVGKKVKIDQEDLLLAEFALMYGWNAYKEARDDLIQSKEMIKMIVAGRKLQSLNQFRLAQASFVATASSKSKKPSATFNSLTRKMVKNSEADE